MERITLSLIGMIIKYVFQGKSCEFFHPQRHEVRNLYTLVIKVFSIITIFPGEVLGQKGVGDAPLVRVPFFTSTSST